MDVDEGKDDSDERDFGGCVWINPRSGLIILLLCLLKCEGKLRRVEN